MYTTSKLNRMPYAQAHIRTFDDGAKVLVSYSTPVVLIDPEGWLTCTGLYSTTTRKHIGAFMHELDTPLCYQDVKNAFLKSYTINIYTGEVKFLNEI